MTRRIERELRRMRRRGRGTRMYVIHRDALHRARTVGRHNVSYSHILAVPALSTNSSVSYRSIHILPTSHRNGILVRWDMQLTPSQWNSLAVDKTAFWSDARCQPTLCSYSMRVSLLDMSRGRHIPPS